MDYSDQERRDTAYHEAGHAVVWHLLGWSIQYVTLEDDWFTQTLGYTRYRIPTDEERSDPALNKRYLRDRILTAYAGGYASERLGDGYDEGGCVNDLSQIAEYNLLLGGDVEEQVNRLTRLSAEARMLVERGWPAIEALASELLEKDDVSEANAVRIIQAALPKPQKEACPHPSHRPRSPKFLTTESTENTESGSDEI